MAVLVTRKLCEGAMSVCEDVYAYVGDTLGVYVVGMCRSESLWLAKSLPDCCQR